MLTNIVCMLTNIHNAPAEGNFCNERGKAIKPQIVVDYNHHMGYVDKGVGVRRFHIEIFDLPS